ncbi:transposable element P transposase isoform X1 [Diabrotica virgifera virgifera]|uniref:Transposable element P transposase n=1 Tax=Diabrotica virgifera virgifera TaxID=50390 RepID=A0ABM5JJ79_DIAVI|nr:transposable element P transposase isoform X1 [Diabrotica virgifera virgifera]
MGACLTLEREEGKARKRSEEIDRQLGEFAKQQNNVIKILLLGAGESGKSTLVKQMKIIHTDGFTHAELSSFRPTVLDNLLASMKYVLVGMGILRINLEHQRNKVHAENVLLAKSCFDMSFTILPDVAASLQALWSDRGVRLAVARGYDYELNDSALYIQTEPLVNQNQELMNEISLLKKQLNAATAKVSAMESTISAVENIFSRNQIKKIQNNKRILWSTSEISKAISLYSAGPRAYRLMIKRGFPYPAVSTLQSWLKKIKIQPGTIKNAFKIVEYSSFSRKDKVCTLLFDEMKIKKEYVYDKSEDQVLQPFSYVQVIMLTGLFKQWKQPVYYNYDTKMTFSILSEVITFVEKAGFQVVAMVCDLGGGNRALHNELEITESKPYFKNPHNGENVYVFADVPHLLKLIRNHFVDEGFIFNGKELNKDCVESVIDATTGSDLKITHKIDKEKLNVRGAHRQRVKYAAKLFSHTVSKAISRCGMLGLINQDENWTELADVFKLVNDWFDIFNVSVPVSDTRTRNRAYGLALEGQNNILQRMSEMVATMRVKGRKSLLPFQKGILMSNKALQLLLEDIKKRYNINYILTRRLNQDPLENFFGVIRAKGGLNDHPTSLDFKYRMRSYLMGKNEGAFSDYCNVEDDGTPTLTISGNMMKSLLQQQLLTPILRMEMT